MEDLDLDELDQAVSQLMDTPGKKAPKKPAEEDKPADAPKATADPVTPVAVAVQPAADKPADEPTNRVVVNRPMPKVPPRQRMRPGAMDIIQPAAKTSTPPSSRPTRMAAAIQPTKEVTPEPAKPAEPTPAEKPAEHSDVSDDVLAALTMLDDPKPSQPAPTPEPKKQPAETWPDPLDFHGFDDKKDEPEPKKEDPKPAEPPKETPPSLEPAAEAPAVPPHDDPLTSPFVTTKVEKRPLGAYADAKPEAPAEPADEPPVPKQETSKEDMAQASLESKQHESAEPEHDMDDLRQMSIPQQYRSEHAKTSEEVHPMYDTKEYHAPPQPIHTSHKGGPWLAISVVVLIVLIIGAVAIGYFMMTGTFDFTKLW